MKPNNKFQLTDKVDAYVVSLHIRNLMNTYGKENVQEIIKVLFLEDQKKTKQRKGA